MSLIEKEAEVLRIIPRLTPAQVAEFDQIGALVRDEVEKALGQ